MKYTLNQLQIFLKVTQKQSVTKAAEELHLTQPAVSIQLRNFQDQFNIPLTEVVGRKIFITDFGKEIAEAAERILEQVHAIDYKSAQYQGQLAGRLKVSVVSTGKYVMPYFLSDFMLKHPNVDLIMDVSNKSLVVESLENNDVDFSLVSILPSHLNIEQMDLLPNDLYLVANKKLQLKKSKGGEVQFDNIPLIYREKGSGTRLSMERFLKGQNVNFSKKIELTSNEAVKQAVIAGLGVSVMPLIGIKNELLREDLQIISVPGLPLQTLWSLIWMKGKKHSPVASAYLKYIQEEKERIVHEKFDWYKQY
jgi:DNA-binding transcriptional LysR family regulator